MSVSRAILISFIVLKGFLQNLSEQERYAVLKALTQELQGENPLALGKVAQRTPVSTFLVFGNVASIFLTGLCSWRFGSIGQ